MRTPIPLTAALFVVLILGCMGKDKDADTDDEVEPTDSDSGEVVDTDTEPDIAFTGAVTLYTATDGEVDCDVEADLSGIDYTGGCAGCDFKFTIRENITRDDSPGGCSNYMPAQTYIGEGLPFDVMMAHADKYVLSGGPYGTTPYPFYDTLLAGLTRPSYGPTWYLTTYEDAAFGTFSREGDTIEWSFSNEYEVYYKDGAFPNYYEICGPYLGYAGASFAGVEGTSGLDCTGDVIDVWEVTSAGGALDISVDTVGTDTTFDPRAWVNAPDACTVAFSDDDYACTFPPPAAGCPTTRIAEEDLSAGTYQVIVQSLGSCAGDAAEYILRVEGAASLELVKNDIDIVTPYTAEKMFAISGTGTILP